MVRSIRNNGLATCIAAYSIFFLMTVPGVNANDYYVDRTYGNDSFVGMSWSTAKQTIPAALLLSSSGDTIHVSEGLYDGNIDLVEGVTVLGGYPAGGGIRNPSVYESLVDIGWGMGSCFIGADNAVIDGFTMAHGTGIEVGGTFSGGAVLCAHTSPIIRNNIMKNNGAGNGGAVFCQSSSALIINNTFLDNEASNFGGAIYLIDSESTIEWNLFTGNLGVFGGAICCENMTTSIVSNNVFHKNIAGYSRSSSGGAIYCLDDAVPTIINNTFMTNECMWKGGGIYCLNNANPVIRNNIFFANIGTGAIFAETASFPSVDHNVFWNCSAGVYWEDWTEYATVADMDSSLPGCEENLDCDPLLTDPKSGDFHLLPGSCCIDTANALDAPATDFDGDRRPFGAGFDIGADEHVPLPVPIIHCYSIGILILVLSLLNRISGLSRYSR